MTSRYPAALDQVDNLPTLTDNLTDLGGDTFNRLRDAILAIENTLGINPQGQFADLVSRLSVIIDTDGSIKKQAFIATGGIYGPVRDADVDPNARIAESKIALVFPTSMLYDTIKILDARNAGLINLITTTNAQLQEHITRASGAHRSTAIAMDIQAVPVQSNIATVKIEQANVQLVLQDIYAKHINFSAGINSNLLTITNSPHQADQIFYDNRNTELATNSVQGAVDNLFIKGTGFINEHQRQLHSNGIQRRIEGVDSNNASGINRGRIILSAFTGIVSYAGLVGSDPSLLINIPIQQGGTNVGVSLIINNSDGTSEAIPIDIDDSLQLTDPLGNQYALLPITDLQILPTIDPITNTSTNYLVGIDVFYNPDVFAALFAANSIIDNNPSLQVTCMVYKKVDIQGNANGLNCIARVLIPNSIAEPNLSSSVSEIQIAHPNAATIISNGFNPSALGRRADGLFDRNFASVLTIVVDGNTYQITIVPFSPVDITLDNCVAKANIECLKQNIPIAAYRLGQEMAFTHNWPDDIFIAGINHTIKIISGGAVDASTAAGFASVVNITTYGSAGNSFVINGVQRSTFRIKIPLEGTAALGKSGFTIFGNVVVLNDIGNNPLAAGIRIGDIVNFQGLTSVSTPIILDGIRRVKALTSDTITVEGNPFPVDVQLTNNATLVIYANTISFDGLAHRFQTDFAGLDPNLSQNLVVQIYMNSAGEVDFHERLAYPNAATISGIPFGGSSLLQLTNLTTDNHGVYIIDCSRGLHGSAQGIRRVISFQFDNQKRVFATFGCQSSPNDGYTISTSLHGPPVNITGDGHYNLVDETGLEFITIQSIKAFNLLSGTILSTIPNGSLLTYVLPIIEFEEINEFENLLLCNVYYNSQINQVSILNGDLALSDKRFSGTIGAEQLRDDVIEKYISGPLGETRGDGVAQGLFVPSDPNATQNITNDKVVYINGGVVYVQGIRYEIGSQQIYVDPATLDVSQYGTDGYFPGTGTNGDKTYKNGYIRYYVFVDHFGRLQTTSRLNLPASLPFVPLAKVVLTTHGLFNNAPNIISVNVVDFRLFISRIDDKIELTVSAMPQQPAHFHSITAALEYIDNMRFNDIISGVNVHIRPTIIRILEGTYQEATTMELPPYVQIKGESAHSVRIRPPINLLGRQSTADGYVDDTVNNQFVFNINTLPEGISAKIENICFDLNTTTTPGSLPVPSSGRVGAIKITWFSNTASIANILPQMINVPSVIDIKGCIFTLDGLTKTTGITNVFSASAPLITGGSAQYSYSYHQLYSNVYFSNYSLYKVAPFNVPSSTPQTTSIPPVAPAQPVNTFVGTGANPPQPGPNIIGSTASAAIGNVVRSSGVVTVDTLATNTFVTGDFVAVGFNPLVEIHFTSLVVQVTVGTPTHFTYVDAGTNATNLAVVTFIDQTSITAAGLDINPKAPFSPEDAIFTDPNAPTNFNHGGIVNIENNVFIITDGAGSICIDRFYDTTTTAGYLGATPIPVSNTRMRGFKILNNSFHYHGSLLNQSKIAPSLNGIIPTTTPVNTTTGTAGQEALRNQMYDLMVHKELRGWVPMQYPNGTIYPDPKDGYGIPDGYWVPPAGGKVTEFMVISNNTPTGLNIVSASSTGFMTETQDSVARDNHGGGTKFGTFTIYPTGLPIIIDRSMDWHDRYVFAYGNNILTDPSSSASVRNKIYTTQPPLSNVWSGVSFIPGGAGVVNGQSIDAAMSDYGSVSNVPTAHGFVYGYTSRLSSDLVTIKHPITVQFPGWSQIKYLGVFSFADIGASPSHSVATSIALVVMPNGELAAFNAGLQSANPNIPIIGGGVSNTNLVQTTDSFPANDINGQTTTDPSRTIDPGSGPQFVPVATVVSFVIQYSPKLNVITTSQFDANTGLNTLDNFGKGWGKI